MKKFLFLIALFTLMGGANSVKAISLGDEITSLSGITDGTMFIISNGTNAKYFYTNNESENAALASVPADAYFYFTLEAYTGDDVENAYYIKITNANGEGYPRGSDGTSNYYLNAVLGYTDVVISGIKSGWGSDKKDALWYVTYDADKGFSFQNVYRAEKSSKSWLAIENSFVADQQYLKLYSKPDDPLADYKAALSAKITRANMYNAFAYTTASFSDLTAEITTAQDALDAAVSAESLTTATTNLQAKIDALEFKEGFQSLTADMFKSWNKADAADAMATGSVDCAYNLFTSTDLPYGEGGVGYLHYADLSSYTTLYVIATDRKPRMMMNRDVDGGQWNATEAESHLIDNTMDGWSAKYFSNEGSVYSTDLESMVADKGFAHLNAIKVEGWGNKDIIKGMYLYRTPDPLQPEKDALQTEINRGNNQTTFARTTASVTALSEAISDGQTELANKEATAESLTNAKNAITAAIAGLKLQAGYANLTSDMFMTHASTDAGAAVTAKAGCAYKLNESTDLAYGDVSVGEKNWADLTPYEQFIVITSTGTPRFCMNRLEAGGQQAATQADSKMIDINPNNSNTWSTTKYQTIDGHKYTINLESIVTDYGFARLHCIKGANYENVTATDFLIYAENSKAVVGAAGCATFSSIMNVDMTGVNAYAAQYDGEKVVLTPVTEVPANTGVIVEAAAGTYNLTNIESADAIADNDLKVSDGTVTGDGSTIFVLNKVGDNVGFYKLENGKKLEAGKAYLKIPGGINSARGIRMVYNSITDVNEVKAQKQKQGAKGVYYNLSGQRVSKPTKGLYIVDGKVVSF